MELIKRNIRKIAILLIIILFIIFLSLKYYLDNNKIEQTTEEDILEVVEDNKEEKEELKVSVDIKGAIKNPGVYEIEDNKKIIDLVKLAGGLTDEADTTYINLARKVTDEMVVIIYTKDQIKKAKEKETLSIENVTNTCICPKITNDACITKENTESSSSSKSSGSSNSNTNKTTNEKININTASLEQLQTLSGIGESKAQSIIDYRNEFGNFSKIEDILNVSGIGESVYEKIKDNITV